MTFFAPTLASLLRSPPNNSFPQKIINRTQPRATLRRMLISQTPAHAAIRAVAFHWPIVLHMARVLSGGMQRGQGDDAPHLPHSYYRFLQRELTLAETILRRILVLLASVCPAPKISIRKRTTRAAHKASDAVVVRAPFFSLLDPAGKPLANTTGPDMSAQAPSGHPRIWWPGKVESAAPPKRQTYLMGAPRDASRLLARIEGLQHVIENTGLHAARMARLIARGCAASADIFNLPKRDRPLRHGRAPGISKKRLRTEWLDFQALNRAAGNFLDAPWPDTG